MAPVTVGILLALAAYAIFRLINTSLTPKKVPKGLHDVSLAGTGAQMGTTPQRQLQKWTSEHGELFKVRLGREEWIYVNSPAAVKEIFDKQSQNSSSRAPSPVVSDLLSGGMR
jgi:cytochrome P450